MLTSEPASAKREGNDLDLGQARPRGRGTAHKLNVLEEDHSLSSKNFQGSQFRAPSESVGDNGYRRKQTVGANTMQRKNDGASQSVQDEEEDDYDDEGWDGADLVDDDFPQIRI